MMWDVVVQAVLDRLEADAELQSLLGAGFRIRNAGELEALENPSIVWNSVSDIEEEVFNPISIQFTIWTRDGSDSAIVKNARIQRRNREILHRDAPHSDFGGVYMATQYEDTQGPFFGGEKGVSQFTQDYQLKPLRSKYPLVPEMS